VIINRNFVLDHRRRLKNMSVWAYDLPMPRDASDAKPFGGDSIAKCLSIPICALCKRVWYSVSSVAARNAERSFCRNHTRSRTSLLQGIIASACCRDTGRHCGRSRERNGGNRRRTSPSEMSFGFCLTQASNKRATRSDL